MYLVRLLKNSLVSVFIEGFSTDMGPDIYGKLELPDGLDGASTTTSIQLFYFFADIVDQLISELGWETRHGA